MTTLNKTRLIMVQGPTELLNCLAIMLMFKEDEPDTEYNDILLLHGHGTIPDGSLSNAVRTIAKVWDWQSIIDISKIEQQLLAEFGADSSRLKVALGVDHVDLLLAGRNWQPTNELMLNCYAGAWKIMYGDNIGLADSFPWKEYVQFDEACLTLPQEWEFTLLDRVPYRVVPKRYMLEAIDRFWEKFPELEQQLIEASGLPEQEKILVLTMATVEAGVVSSFDEDLAIRQQQILRYCTTADRLILKPHPREQSGQTTELVSRLAMHGITAISLDSTIAALPVELLYRKLGLSKVLSIGSTAHTWLDFLYNAPYITVPIDEICRTISFRHREFIAQSLAQSEEISALIKSWDGSSVIWRLPATNLDRHLASEGIDAVNREDWQTGVRIFRLLTETGCRLPLTVYGLARSLSGLGQFEQTEPLLNELGATNYADLAEELILASKQSRTAESARIKATEALATGNTSAALAAFAEALQTAPHDSGLVMEFGRLLEHTGQNELASQLYQLFLKQHPKDKQVSAAFQLLSAKQADIEEQPVIWGSSERLPDFSMQDRYLSEKRRLVVGDDNMLACTIMFDAPHGEVRIGNHCFIGGSRLSAVDLIEIGNYVTIAWGCSISDHDEFPSDALVRQEEIARRCKAVRSGTDPVIGMDWSTVAKAPVRICDNVWIGMHCTILKGVTIGEGAVISAGSVVYEDVEPWSLVVGNPARELF